MWNAGLDRLYETDTKPKNDGKTLRFQRRGMPPIHHEGFIFGPPPGFVNLRFFLPQGGELSAARLSAGLPASRKPGSSSCTRFAANYRSDWTRKIHPSPRFMRLFAITHSPVTAITECAFRFGDTSIVNMVRRVR
jgi:hypothetical protein